MPIDPVRDITNRSKGTFGSKLAAAALETGHKVIYLCADDARSPFSITFDFYRRTEPLQTQLDMLQSARHFADRFRSNYDEHRFRNFIDYSNLLKRTCEDDQPRIVILAAAVSDYLVTPSKEKVRSGSEMTVQLEPAPKLIGKIKEWLPGCILCGFKMLVDTTDEKLIEAAWESVGKNGCDMVVANDLLSVNRGQHEIIMVEPTFYMDTPGEPPVTTKVRTNLATTVINKLLEFAE